MRDRLSCSSSCSIEKRSSASAIDACVFRFRHAVTERVSPFFAVVRQGTREDRVVDETIQGRTEVWDRKSESRGTLPRYSPRRSLPTSRSTTSAAAPANDESGGHMWPRSWATLSYGALAN